MSSLIFKLKYLITLKSTSLRLILAKKAIFYIAVIKAKLKKY